MKKTKILATMGPSCNDYKTMKDMVIAGLNGVRVNLSHGDLETHKKVIDNAKQIRKELGLPLSIVVDTRGPEVRVGKFKNGKETLKKGQSFVLYSKDSLGDNNGVSVSEPIIFKALKVGGKVLACDGLIVMKITEIKDDQVITKIVHGGVISDRKSLFLPNVEYNFPYLNEKDKHDIIWAIGQDVDYFAISFVNSRKDVDLVRELIVKHGGKQQIISKVESKLGVKNIDEIIDASDGIMVARGDLGVELPLQKLPSIQKDMIRKCLEKGKFVITATEMLDSMIESIRPTRAEVSDVANAVLDGSSVVMLSGETAVGKHPINVIKTMASIVTQAEKSVKYASNFERLNFKTKDIPDIISYNTVSSSFSSNSKAIVVITNSGRTAKLTSRFQSECPIVAITDEMEVYHKLALIGNIVPAYTKIPYGKLSQIITIANKIVKELKIANTGDIVVVSSASRNNDIDTDFIKIEKVD